MSSKQALNMTTKLDISEEYSDEVSQCTVELVVHNTLA